MTMNLNRLRMSPVSLDAGKAEQVIELDPGVPTSEIELRLSGSLTVAGATPATAVVFDDAPERLISRITLDYDGEPIIRSIPLRDMHQIWRRNLVREPVQTRVTTAQVAGAAGTYPFELFTGIYFSSRWLRRPWDTHLPAIPNVKRLNLRIEFDLTKRQAATDGAGTGAFIKTAGTTAVYTFGSVPTVEAVQVSHPRAGTRPAAIRMFQQFVTDDWAAAQATLTERMQSERPFDMQLLRMCYGANEELEDNLNTLTFLSTRDKFYDRYTLAMARAEECKLFPAITTPTTGYLGMLHAHDGMLSNIVQPNDHPGLRYEFDTKNPTSGTSKIVITTAQIVEPNKR